MANPVVAAIVEGGWGMYPVLACGVAAVAASVRFALRPDARGEAVVEGLERAVIAFGVAGTVTGFVATGAFVGSVGEGELARIVVQGVKESLQNAAFASLFVAVSRTVSVVGRGRRAAA